MDGISLKMQCMVNGLLWTVYAVYVLILKKVLYTSKFTIAQFAHYVMEFQMRRMVMMKNWVIREDMTKSHIKNYDTTKLAHVLC